MLPITPVMFNSGLGLRPVASLLADILALRGSAGPSNVSNYFADAFFNSSGIDAGASTNESYNSTDDYYEATETSATPSGLTNPVVGQGTGTRTNYNDRYVIPNAQLTDGGRMRLSFNGGTYDLDIEGVAVGSRAASGDAYDFESGTITNVTFDGGNPDVFRSASSGVFYSDYFNIDVTALRATGRDLIVSVGINAGRNKGDTFTGSGITLYQKTSSGAADFDVANVTGYGSAAQQRFIFNGMEIFQRDNLELITNAYTAPVIPGRANIVAVYKPRVSATINTDFKGKVSRVSSPSYTDFTLTDGGLIGGGGSLSTYRFAHGELNISAQSSGTAMRFGVRNLNNKDVIYGGIAGSFGN